MGRRVRTRVVRGPLAPWAAGFERWLVAQGHLPSAVLHRLCLLGALSRWLEREGLGAGELTAERVELFSGERRAAGYVTCVDQLAAGVAVPGVADQRDRSLPRGWEPAVVRKLLAGCDRRRTVGC
jgi:hypothetical protein